MRPHFVLSLAWLVVINSAHAGGLVDATSSAPATIAPIQAVIATHELSRIAIDGGRIAALIDYRQAVHARKEDATGQFFIAPKDAGSKPINLFAIDEAGHTYALLLTPRDVPAQSVILKAARSSTREPFSPRAATLPRAVKQIVVGLMQERDDAKSSRAAEEIALWEEARFVRVATQTVGALVGERFVLTNVSREAMRLREEELYTEGVVAISIAEHVLPPHASTIVVVVRERRNDE